MARAAEKSSIVMTPEEAKNCKTVQCNCMNYTDAEGKQHSIYMPAGTLEIASKYFVENNFEELAKFPAWAGQQYTEKDYIETKE
ncbi:hypothetical protein MMC17_002669 [Xylographa soralifera]|nr:hypothetical protein [Xylographa soralifera]